MSMEANRDLARRRFTQMAAPYLDDAFTLARWLTGNPSDAQDVVQEACLRALTALAATPPDNPRAWLLAVTRNAAFTWLAKNRPRALMLVGGAQEMEAVMTDDAPSPEQALIEQADQASVTQAIGALPLVYRETLVMREINGLSYRDIAEATQAPVGTVMSRLARARALLAQQLGASR